jgi:hypothetical protein
MRPILPAVSTLILLAIMAMVSLLMLKPTSPAVVQPPHSSLVKTEVRKTAPGQLQVVLSVTDPANRITDVRFGTASNASHTNVTFTGRTATFTILRGEDANAGSSVLFTVITDKGEWKTFAGGGPGAF